MMLARCQTCCPVLKMPESPMGSPDFDFRIPVPIRNVQGGPASAEKMADRAATHRVFASCARLHAGRPPASTLNHCRANGKLLTSGNYCVTRELASPPRLC